VIVVDDQPVVRAGFVAILDAEPDIAVVGEAADGAAAVALCRQVTPDVVLMDIRMPGMDGLTATRLLTAASLRVLVLTTFDLDEYVFEALRAGASGFLLKDAEPADLVEAIRVIAAGEAMLAPTVTRRLIDAFASGAVSAPGPAAGPSVLDALTPREREVLCLVGAGLSNGEIAERLVLSPLTAKTHVSRLLMKLGARDRAQLVVVAYESGLVVPGGLA
jgi:DNA-binding NarL/FixJ family response regulator